MHIYSLISSTLHYHVIDVIYSTCLEGEYQPDNDDYGYSSSFAEEMHKKIMERYKSIPTNSPSQKPKLNAEVPRIQSLNGQKFRGIEKESFEAAKVKDDSSAKLKKPKPPPNLMSYEDMLKLAEKKKEEPVITKKVKIDRKEDETDFEFGRPMTAKEKATYLQEKAFKDRIAAGGSRSDPVAKTDTNNNPLSSKPSAEKSFKIPSKKSMPMRPGGPSRDLPPPSVKIPPSAPTSSKSNFPKQAGRPEPSASRVERSQPANVKERDNFTSPSSSAKRKVSAPDPSHIERKMSKSSNPGQLPRKLESFSDSKMQKEVHRANDDQRCSTGSNRRLLEQNKMTKQQPPRREEMLQRQRPDKRSGKPDHRPKPMPRNPHAPDRSEFRKKPMPVPQYKGGL